MSLHKKIILGQAWRIAERIREAYSPHCELMEVAGSVRRRAHECGDIEFVCIPKIKGNLFGEASGRTQLDEQLERDVATGLLGKVVLNGPRQKRIELVGRGGLCVEFFCVDAVRFGVAMAIRTGPSAFSKAIVTERSRGGLLPDGHAVLDNRIWSRCTRNEKHEAVEVDAPLPTSKEEQVLKIVCGRWIEPPRRGWEAIKECRAKLGLEVTHA